VRHKKLHFLNIKRDSAIHMKKHLVIMGVAGCGKSSVGEAIAHALGMRLEEGDTLHDAGSLAKMRQGLALTDADRETWLARLGGLLAQASQPTVLTCSALRLRYREQLRQASPGLRFVYLEIPRELAQLRVSQRSGAHFFPSSLVESQFATLEEPLQEAGVLRVDASWSVSQIVQRSKDWFCNKEGFKA
jgi:gluconokinase